MGPTSSTPSASCSPRPMGRPRRRRRRSYTAKAVELMARHGIDEALLAAAPIPGRPAATRSAPAASRWTIHTARARPGCLAWTARALRCRAVLHEAGGGRVAARHRVRVRVRPGAGRAAVHVAAAAGRHPAGRRCAPRGRASRSRPTGGRGCTGSPLRVHHRLGRSRGRGGRPRHRPARHPPRRGGRSVALVLADRNGRVERAYAEAFPRLGRARRAGLSGSGYAAGAGQADGPISDGRPCVPAAAGPRCLAAGPVTITGWCRSGQSWPPCAPLRRSWTVVRARCPRVGSATRSRAGQAARAADGGQHPPHLQRPQRAEGVAGVAGEPHGAAEAHGVGARPEVLPAVVHGPDAAGRDDRQGHAGVAQLRDHPQADRLDRPAGEPAVAVREERASRCAGPAAAPSRC